MIRLFWLGPRCAPDPCPVTSTDSVLAVLSVPECVGKLHMLAEQLQLPLVTESTSCASNALLLTVVNGRLVIVQPGPKAPGPVGVDFNGSAATYRRTKGGGELIVKAVGGDKHHRPRVVDATAGLGRDSFVLASWGFPVVMCERSPVIAALLADGLSHAQRCGDADVIAVAERMQLESRDAVAYLQSLQDDDCPDVVLIDPMFPESGKSALVKKEMRVFQQLVGPDTDSAVLLQAALDTARHRVVVKRPRKAGYLSDRTPNFSVTGKAIRFDVYTIRAFAKS